MIRRLSPTRFLFVTVLMLCLTVAGGVGATEHPGEIGAVPGMPSGEILEVEPAGERRSGTSFTPTVALSPVYDVVYGFAYFRSLPEKPGFEYGAKINGTAEDGESFQFNYDKWTSPKRLFSLRFSCSTFFDPYYGEGNDTDEDSDVRLEGTRYRMQLFAKRSIGGSFTAGPYLDIRTRDEQSVDGDSALRVIPDEASMALGACVTYDTRDSTMSPSRGQFAEFRLAYVPDALTTLDNTNGFASGSVDIRLFDSLAPGWIIGGRLHFGSSLGGPSYLFRHTLGGPDDLRGYLINRFRGDSFYLVQWETRFPLLWVFTGAAFAGLGDVGDDSFRRPKWSAGLGIRASLPPDWVKKARVDVAWSEDQHAVRFLFGEAF